MSEKEKPTFNRCAKTSVAGSSGWHNTGCSRDGKTLEEGKWWCYQHIPSVIKEKRSAEKKKWDHEWKVREVRNEIAHAQFAIVDLVMIHDVGLPEAIQEAKYELVALEAQMVTLKDAKA